MSQQRVGAANQARAGAKAAQMSAVGDLASAGGDLVTAGMKGGGKTTDWTNEDGTPYEEKSWDD